MSLALEASKRARAILEEELVAAPGSVAFSTAPFTELEICELTGDIGKCYESLGWYKDALVELER
jgi:hypothetical protein